MDKEYKVELDIYNGPLDLLLYLIKKEEVDIYDIPVARITQQYLGYLEIIKIIDINLAGEFLVMASLLMEIKSKMLLPREALPELNIEEEDPRLELVKQLIEYKRYKDAAALLEDRAEIVGGMFPRPDVKSDVHITHEDNKSVILKDADVWDLLTAFSKLMSETSQDKRVTIIDDNTPVEVYMNFILEKAERGGAFTFLDLFGGQIHRAKIIGIFLALLELVKCQLIRVTQEQTFGNIYIHKREKTENKETPVV